MQCPACDAAELVFDWATGTTRCPACGYRPDAGDNAEQSGNASPRPPLAFTPPPGLDMDDLPASLGDYDRVRLRGRLQEAMWALARDDRDEIRRKLEAVIEISDEHADTWLQLAALATSADEQRRCLEHVIALRPGHPLAMRLLAELDSALQPEEPLPATAGLAPGQAPTERLVCPQCGGQLTYDEAERLVHCRFCGYRLLDADDLDRTDRHTTILEGNLKRKMQAHRWNLGPRWLRCQSCGAITTLAPTTLTTTCRFCQSQHLIQESVTHAFEQPDVIVPFALNQIEARQAVETYLRSGLRRITRFFADDVARIDLQGSYLPFWIFDADMIVHWSWTRAAAHGQHPVLLSDVLHAAVPTPPAALLRKLEPYDLRRGVDYDPRLLAAHPAQIYATDMTQASLDVRPRLTREALRQAEPGLRVRRPRGTGRNDDPGTLQIRAYTQFMTYRLSLLPVWIGQLVEVDGDTQLVLVNGQTGRVALDKQRRATG